MSYFGQNKHHHDFLKYFYIVSITTNYNGGVPNFAYLVFSIRRPTLLQTKSEQASSVLFSRSNSDTLMHDLIAKTEGHMSLYNLLYKQML